MIVITHHRVGTDVYGEDRGEFLESLHQPAFAMIEIAPTNRIITTKVGSTHASGDAVVVGRAFQRDLLGSCQSQFESILHFQRTGIGNSSGFAISCKESSEISSDSDTASGPVADDR